MCSRRPFHCYWYFCCSYWYCRASVRRRPSTTCAAAGGRRSPPSAACCSVWNCPPAPAPVSAEPRPSSPPGRRRRADWGGQLWLPRWCQLREWHWPRCSERTRWSGRCWTRRTPWSAKSAEAVEYEMLQSGRGEKVKESDA